MARAGHNRLARKNSKSQSLEADEKGKVVSECRDAITTITFSHPKANSFPLCLLLELATAIENAGKDPHSNVIVLQSEGQGTFSAGASFREFERIATEEDAKNFFGGFAQVILAIVRAPKFVICRVQGKTVGGGVGIIAACDYVIALSTAEVKLSELELGIGPFVISEAVCRRVGQTAFATMTIDCVWRPASWSHAKGLFSMVENDSAALDVAVGRMAQRLAGVPRKTTQQLKQLFVRDTIDWEALLSERATINGHLLVAAKRLK